MADIPKFYCSRTLLGHSGGIDPNQIVLIGPHGFEFVLYELNEPRSEGNRIATVGRDAAESDDLQGYQRWMGDEAKKP